MKAVFLIDNNSYDDLEKEWGLSIYIEEDGHRILLDTGKSDAFLKNAEALNIDLSKVECCVISHAHYDHADGIPAFLAVNDTAKVLVRKGARENCYDIKDRVKKYIGIKKGTLRKYAERIEYVDGIYGIFPYFYLVPHSKPCRSIIGLISNMYVKRGFRYIPDDFSHEQSLVIETTDGLAIFSSCSHTGADEIIDEIKTAFPDKKISTIIGGFHLYKKGPEEVRDFAKRLKDTGVKRIITGHCTGDTQFDILKEALGDCIEKMYSGLTVTIEAKDIEVLEAKNTGSQRGAVGR